ncbi:MAG: chemotaxis protein CheW [Syntrophobacteraceae bacterium]
MSTQEFLQDYIEEVQEHLLDMEKSLLVLEQEGTDQEQIAQVFRAAHSIKGASTYMGFEGLAALTHELESLISGIQLSARSVPSEGISLLLKCVDLISRSVEHVKLKGAEPPLDTSFLEDLRSAFSPGEVLANLSEGKPGGLSANEAAVTSPSAGMDADILETLQPSDEVLEFPSPIEEEDEELLGIFISSFRENFFQLLNILKSSTEACMADEEGKRACELVEKLMSSAQYMDYQPVSACLSELEKFLHPSNGNGVRKNEMEKRLEACARQLDTLIPGLAISSSAPSGQDLPEMDFKEEDEELLQIFISSFRENYSILADHLKLTAQGALGEEEIATARELVERLISSAQYMDYQPVVTLLADWEMDLDGSNAEKPSGQEMLKLLEKCAKQLDGIVPGLEIASSYEPEHVVPESRVCPECPIEEEDQELFAIFLSSFQQNFSKLSEIISSHNLAPHDFESAFELTGNLIQSSQYMDYQQIVGLVEEWNEALADFRSRKKADPALLQKLFSTLGRELQEKLTGFEIPDFSGRQSEDEYPDMLHELDLLFEPASGPAIEFPAQEPDVFAASPVDRSPQAPVMPASEARPAPPAGGKQKEERPSAGQDIRVPVKSQASKDPAPAAAKKERTVLVTEEVQHHSTTLRVDAKKVDQLLNQVGELVVTRSEFIQTASFFRDILRDLTTQGLLPKNELRRLRLLTFRLNESTQSLGRVANDLQASVMRVRMLPISQLFQRFPRIVRDQALKQGKHVELIIEGGDTEIDKRVLEQMNDPLVQFLRNAIVHGIEHPDERLRAGKPETGVIRLAAYHSGDYVAIEIEDDGQGVNTQKLRALLQKRKEISQHEMERLSDEEIAYSIFMPGISTYEKVDGAAGRGVGLDVVKENVEHMNGSVEVESHPGQGTRFIIRIPLTVAIIRALLVREAEQIFTLPLTSVTEILRYRPEATFSIEGFRVITLRGKTIPLVNLRDLLSMGSNLHEDRHRFIVIVSTSFREVGLIVDGLIGEREVVIKSIENGLQTIEGFSGATILGDGRVSLIVDVSALLKMMKSSFNPRRIAKSTEYVH